MQANVNRQDILTGHELAKICVGSGNAIPVSHLPDVRLVLIGNRDDIDIRKGSVFVQVKLSDLADPNYAYAQFILQVSLLVR